MGRKKQFAVVGLGRFGRAVGMELMRLGHDVLGIDTDAALVTASADELTQAVTADASDERVIEELGLKQFDAVLVAIGENLEGSILTTLALKSAGVKKLWVKALNEAHHRIIDKLKADRIIHPEFEMGLRIAQSLDRPEVVDYISLGGDWFIVEVILQAALDNTSVGELRLKSGGKAEILSLRQGAEVIRHPADHSMMRSGDRLALMGQAEDLRRLSDLL